MDSSAVAIAEVSPALTNDVILNELEHLCRSSKNGKPIISVPTNCHTGTWFLFLVKQSISSTFLIPCVDVKVSVQLTGVEGTLGFVEYIRVGKVSRCKSRLPPGSLIFKVGSPFSLYCWLNQFSYISGRCLRQFDVHVMEFVSTTATPPSKWVEFSRAAALSDKPSASRTIEAATIMADSGGDILMPELLRMCPSLVSAVPTIEVGARLMAATRAVTPPNETETPHDPIALWLCGGPGTGKSSIVRDVFMKLKTQRPETVYFASSGRTGGFHQGLTTKCEVFIVDEFTFKKLSPDEILNMVSPSVARLNVKGSDAELPNLKMLIIISNFEPEYFMQLKAFERHWIAIDKAAFMRRFTVVNIGNPDSAQLEALNIVKLQDKGGFAVELIGNYFATLCIDAVKGVLQHQLVAFNDPRREALRHFVANQLSLRPEPSLPSTAPDSSSPPRKPYLWSQSTPCKSFALDNVPSTAESPTTTTTPTDPISIYDQVATGRNRKLLPPLNFVRVLSPTRRTYVQQVKALGEHVEAHRSDQETTGDYPAISFSKRLNGTAWDLIHEDSDDYNKPCWEFFENEFEAVTGRRLDRRDQMLSFKVKYRPPLSPPSDSDEDEEDVCFPKIGDLLAPANKKNRSH